jgi:hypothetical protein
VRRLTIISGAQTGVDRAALDAALAAGLPCGGYVPKGRRAEDGRVPDRYPVTECGSPEYPVRTELNVVHSDATLVLNCGPLEGGTRLTLALCRRHAKPHALVALDHGNVARAAREVRAFLRRERPGVLNVAGPRESKSPGVYALSLAVLAAALGPEGPR